MVSFPGSTDGDSPKGPDDYLLDSAGEIQRRLPLSIEDARPGSLEKKNVPRSLQDLIPLAEEWGIGDDTVRWNLVHSADPESLRMLVESVDSSIDEIEEWLAGSAASDPNPTREYLAFSNMLMASDEAR